MSLEAYSPRQLQDCRTLLGELRAGGLTTLAEVLARLDSQIGAARPLPPRPRGASARRQGRCPHCGGILRRLPVNTTPANQTGDESTAVFLCVRCHYEEWC